MTIERRNFIKAGAYSLLASISPASKGLSENALSSAAEIRPGEPSAGCSVPG